jgi:hypothetical protein
MTFLRGGTFKNRVSRFSRDYHTASMVSPGQGCVGSVRVTGTPIRGRTNNLIPQITKLSAIDVTAKAKQGKKRKAIYERLVLFRDGEDLNCFSFVPSSPTPPPDQGAAISRFPSLLFP